MKASQVKYREGLEVENQRPRQTVADLTTDGLYHWLEFSQPLDSLVKGQPPVSSQQHNVMSQ